MIQLLDAVALSLVPGRRARLAAALRGASAARPPADQDFGQPPEDLEQCGPPCDAFGPGGIVEQVLRRAGFGLDIDGHAARLRESAARLLEQAAREGIEAIAWQSASYPPALAAIPDPPPVLWVRGRADTLGQASVAIVGSRAGSEYGLEMAGRLAGDLARRGLVVVSGLARGVDSAAHRGALEAAGLTIAVLGSGLDVIYPPEHRRLAERVAGSGALVSELGPGAPPLAFHFPLRNRIISGLALGVVVVEAADGSGSLITAECALEQGREVMAVPGSVLSGRHRGCHRLIRDGAAIVEEADEVLFQVGASGLVAGAGTPRGAVPGDPLLALMSAGESYDVDALAASAGLEAVRLLPRLLELELAGRVRRVAGGRFVRSGGTC